MEIIKIIKQTENPLFKRREVEIEVKAEVVPSYSETEKILAEKFSGHTEAIKIKQVKGKFGSNHFLVIANIYDSKEKKEATEPKLKKHKKKEAEEKKA